MVPEAMDNLSRTGVDIWVNIEWSYPIRLYVDYFVVNP